MAKVSKALCLGMLQENAEQTARTLKTAGTNLKKAKDAFGKADAEYHVAQNALSAGIEQLQAATKVN